MAEVSENGQYVKVTVQVWYDRSTKRVHLTSNDPDLPKAGIHTNLKPGSQADRSAKALLAKFGELPEGVDWGVPIKPDHAARLSDSNHDSNRADRDQALPATGWYSSRARDQ
jgi:hypothetical protein